MNAPPSSARGSTSPADLRIARLVAGWTEVDRNVALLPGDRVALEATLSLRALVIELLLLDLEARGARSPHRDLYHACIRMGSELAARGGSPTLAGGAIDGARAAFASEGIEIAGAVWRAVHSAVLEGYVRGIRDEAERVSFATWDPPHCLVILGKESAAVVAGHPSRDRDVLLGWAGRVAGALLVRGIRRVAVGGEDGPVRTVLLAALAEARIEATRAG